MHFFNKFRKPSHKMPTTDVENRFSPVLQQPPHLAKLHQRILEIDDPGEFATWDFLQPLFYYPDSDTEVVKRVREHLNLHCCHDPENVRGFTEEQRLCAWESICDYVMEAAAGYPENHLVHGRLLSLLRSFNESSWIDGSKKEFRLVHNPEYLSQAAYEFERITDVYDHGDPSEDYTERTFVHINSVAFLATLLRDGLLLPKDGVLWASRSLTNGLEPSWSHGNFDYVPKELVKACTIASTRWILLAGDKIVERLKSGLEDYKHTPLTEQKWQLWAARFREIASSDEVEEGPWKLKSSAAKAHARMIELYPELFDDKSQAPTKDKAAVVIDEKV